MPWFSAMTQGHRYLVFVSRFAAGSDGGLQALWLDAVNGCLSAGAQSGDGQVFFLAATHRPDRLYSLRADNFGAGDQAEEVVAWEVAGSDGALREIGRTRTHGLATCYLSADLAGRFLLAANYTSGNLVSIPLDACGVPGEAASVIPLAGASVHPSRQTSPHPHSFIAVQGPWEEFPTAYAADLGTDRVSGFHIDPVTARCSPLDPAYCAALPGAGPRHLVMHPQGAWLYGIDELANTVTLYARDPATGALARRQSLSALPPDFHGVSFGGDIVIAPDGRFLYATNRGHDSIAMFRIGREGVLSGLVCIPSGGEGPQNLAVTPDGRWLLCANMPGGNVVVFRLDASGTPVPAGAPFAMPAPSCLVFR